MNKYHIRFNHNHNNTDLVWRVFENGVENLASDVEIHGKVFTESTIENGIQKWNVCCYGSCEWNNNVAIINAKYEN